MSSDVARSLPFHQPVYGTRCVLYLFNEPALFEFLCSLWADRGDEIDPQVVPTRISECRGQKAKPDQNEKPSRDQPPDPSESEIGSYAQDYADKSSSKPEQRDWLGGSMPYQNTHGFRWPPPPAAFSDSKKGG